MTRHGFVVPMLIAAGLPPLSANAGPTTVEVPPGFGVELRHKQVPVVYSESTGESANTVDRRNLEALCRQKQALGATQRQPVFGAGDGQPSRHTHVRFSTPSRSVTFVTRQVYACDPLPADRDVCGCTYEVRTYRSVLRHNGEVSRAGQAAAALLPEMVGRAEIAGLPCVVRRRSFGAGFMERCLVEDPERKLPPALRGQELSFRNADARGALAYSSTVTRLLADAQVDAGVFEPLKVPSGPVMPGEPR